ncbi:MAG: hypothetical protein QOD93_4675 [Acetobacteraceae bacterium]|nr:hypothetical protein [Acetobacteraceae bacterium]
MPEDQCLQETAPSAGNRKTSVAWRCCPTWVITNRPSSCRQHRPRPDSRCRQGSSARPAGRPAGAQRYTRWRAARQHVSRYGWDHITSAFGKSVTETGLPRDDWSVTPAGDLTSRRARVASASTYDRLVLIGGAGGLQGATRLVRQSFTSALCGYNAMDIKMTDCVDPAFECVGMPTERVDPDQSVDIANETVARYRVGIRRVHE